MMYTYDKIIEISIKINRTNTLLNTDALEKLNNLKKKLNIPVTEILKKKVVNKKEEISKI